MKIEFAPAHLYRRALEIISRLRAAGHEAYIAGGAVRDHLLGRPQKDLDIATSAKPEEVRALFPRTFAVGESFGVIIVRHRGREFEVATFREESGYEDGRHPGKVRYSTAKADVLRRDFTINGMLWDPEKERVLDWVGGKKDVAARLIRTIGPPEERFAEDRLRMLRAVRFSAQLDFSLAPATLQAIRRQGENLKAVSLERVRQELDKMLAATAAARGVALLANSGLGKVLAAWLREEAARPLRNRDLFLGTRKSGAWLKAWLACDQRRSAVHASTPLSGLVFLLLDMTGLAPDALQPERDRDLEHTLEALMRALRGSRQDVATATSAAWILCHLRRLPDTRLADQLRLLRRAEAPWVLEVARRHSSFASLPWTQLSRTVAAHVDTWHAPPLLSGTDLLALGLPPGPTVGSLLHELESLQLEGRLTTRAEALGWLQSQAPPS